MECLEILHQVFLGLEAMEKSILLMSLCMCSAALMINIFATNMWLQASQPFAEDCISLLTYLQTWLGDK